MENFLDECISLTADLAYTKIIEILKKSSLKCEKQISWNEVFNLDPELAKLQGKTLQDMLLKTKKDVIEKLKKSGSIKVIEENNDYFTVNWQF